MVSTIETVSCSDVLDEYYQRILGAPGWRPLRPRPCRPLSYRQFQRCLPPHAVGSARAAPRGRKTQRYRTQKRRQEGDGRIAQAALPWAASHTAQTSEPRLRRLCFWAARREQFVGTGEHMPGPRIKITARKLAQLCASLRRVCGSDVAVDHVRGGSMRRLRDVRLHTPPKGKRGTRAIHVVEDGQEKYYDPGYEFDTEAVIIGGERRWPAALLEKESEGSAKPRGGQSLPLRANEPVPCPSESD